MAKQIVGLDVGTRFVKAVQLTEEGGRWSLTEFGIEPVEQPEQPESAISSLFARKAFKGNKRVNLGISGRSVFVRYVPMPKMSEIPNSVKLHSLRKLVNGSMSGLASHW